MEQLKNWIHSQKSLITYGMISVFVTVIDVSICYFGELVVDKLIANAIGVITGFVIQYILASKKVFNSRNKRTFIIFILTFLVGLALAQGIVWLSRDSLFHGADTLLAFGVSKGLSIIIPFFVLYYIRLKLIKIDDSKDGQ